MVTAPPPDRGPIEALVFDLDGLLVDSEQRLSAVWIATYARFDATFTAEEWLRCVGSDGGFDPYATLAVRARKPLPGRDELLSSVAVEEGELLSGLEAMPGVTEWLQSARRLDLDVAVASSSTEETVRDRLARADLAAFFEVVVGRTTTLRAKPAPDIYLEACRRLAVAPERALAIEDSPNGLTAALAAGMTCLVVPNHVTVSGDFAGATLQATGLDMLSLRAALALLEARPAVPPAPGGGHSHRQRS